MTPRVLRSAVAVGCVVAVSAFARLASAEPVRILVAAGHRMGLAAEKPLKYANNDATRVRDVMVGFGGVRPENAIVVAEPTRAQLFSAIDRARDEAQKHAPNEVTLVLYFSGHGDREALHLGDERVLLSELTAKLSEVPASLRIAITDACRTSREKGFVADEPFTVSPLTTVQATGQVWLHASQDGEAAQESDELGGAIFTHAWLNGLRGAADTNGDRRVTLDESFAFAHTQTLLRSAKSSGVVQKPEAIVTLRELSPVVLTQTSGVMGTLSLPPAKDTHFLVYAAESKSIWSEVWSAPDRRLTLAVPPGRYAVHRHSGSIGGAAQIAVAAGETRTLEDRDFGSFVAEPLAQKGEEDRGVDTTAHPRHHEISAGYDAGGDSRIGFFQGPRLGYAYTWSRWALYGGGGFDMASRSVSGTDERLVTGFVRGLVELRVPFEPLTLRLAVGPRAGWVHQSIRPSIGNGAANGAFTAGPEALVALRVALGPSFFVDGVGNGSLLFVKEEGSMRGVAAATLGAQLGAHF